MLEMIVASAVRRHDLQAYFRTIAHYALESRTEGESYFTNDHPVGWDLSLKERWIDARLDLLPAATLYSLNLDHPPVMADAVIDGDDHETAVCLREDCALVIAPLGQNGKPEARLVSSKRIDLESRTAPGLRVSFFPWNEFTPQAGATVVGKIEGSYRSVTLRAAQPLDVLVRLVGDLGAVDVSTLTLDNLYEALYRRPLGHGMARTIDDNLDLTFQFRSPTEAPAQSLAAYIERNLRELSRDDLARLDNQLHADVQRLAQELEACRTAIRHELTGSFDRFRHEQEGAEIVTLRAGSTEPPEASHKESRP